MKLYFEHNNLNLLNLGILERYKQKTEIENILYSNEGLFKIESNCYKKLNIKDKSIEKIYINDVEFLLDNSTLQYQISHKIPFQHKIIKNNLHYYGLSNKSKIFLILKENNNKVNDFYFETIEDPNHFSIQEEINTLFSYLN